MNSDALRLDSPLHKILPVSLQNRTRLALLTQHVFTT